MIYCSKSTSVASACQHSEFLRVQGSEVCFTVTNGIARVSVRQGNYLATFLISCHCNIGPKPLNRGQKKNIMFWLGIHDFLATNKAGYVLTSCLVSRFQMLKCTTCLIADKV